MKKVFLLSLLTITGCASILEGNTQKVSVRMEPDVKGKCAIAQRHAEVNGFRAPAEVDISRSYYPFDIKCVADNGEKGEAQVYSNVSSLGYTGAVASVGIGAVVDTTTGSAFDYPNLIVVKLGENIEIGKTSMNSNVEFDK